MGNIGYYFYWGLEGAGHYSFNRFIRFQPNFIQSIIIRANIGYYFFGDLQNFYCTLKFLSAQDHIGLEISKRYSSYRFHLMSTKLYEDIAYHKGMQAITLLGNRPSFTKFKTLWNNISQWEKLKCVISRKQLIKERNRWKFGTWGTTLHTWKLSHGTLDARFLEFGMEPFGALCKMSNFAFFFKTLLLSQFSSDSSKLYTRYPNHGAI